MASSCTKERAVAMAMSRSRPTPRIRETTMAMPTSTMARATSPNPMCAPTFTVLATPSGDARRVLRRKPSRRSDLDDVVGQLGGVARLVGHHDDGQPVVGQPPDQPLNAALRAGIQRRRRLVQRE